MASKVPKFGAWEGGENYTVCFDNARKTKNNGAMINPNDPEENPDMFQQDGGSVQAPPAHNRNDSQASQQSKVPQFGAWDSGDNVGYTVYFEKARKTKNDPPTKPENEPQPNQNTNPRKKSPAQTRPAAIKPEPQVAQSKVPQFGAWEGEGEAQYTMCFENVRKNKNGIATTEEPSKANQPNQGTSPPQKEPRAEKPRSKVPQFGAWDGGENVQYTAYFDNARKNREEPVEPQLNRDVADRSRPPSAGGGARPKPEQIGTKEGGDSRNASRGSESSQKPGRPALGGQSPLNSRGGKPQPKPVSRGSQSSQPEKGTAIPQWGVWNTDPAQAEGFTGAFTRAREDRMTPQNRNTPSSYRQQGHHSNEEPKKGCCFSCFG